MRDSGRVHLGEKEQSGCLLFSMAVGETWESLHTFSFLFNIRRQTAADHDPPSLRHGIKFGRTKSILPTLSSHTHIAAVFTATALADGFTYVPCVPINRLPFREVQYGHTQNVYICICI